MFLRLYTDKVKDIPIEQRLVKLAVESGTRAGSQPEPSSAGGLIGSCSLRLACYTARIGGDSKKEEDPAAPSAVYL